MLVHVITTLKKHYLLNCTSSYMYLCYKSPSPGNEEIKVQVQSELGVQKNYNLE